LTLALSSSSLKLRNVIELDYEWLKAREIKKILEGKKRGDY